MMLVSSSSVFQTACLKFKECAVERRCAERERQDEPHADRYRFYDLHAHAFRAGVDQEEHWFAQLRLVFSCTDATGAVHRLAFLRWLRSTGGAELPMQRLTWATQDCAGGPQRPCYDCQDIDCIKRQMLLQQDPGHNGFFYYNHFMRCGTGHPLPAPVADLLQSPF